MEIPTNYKKFYGTFGSGQLASCGLHCHVEVYAPVELLARMVMAKATDGKWCGIYDSEQLNYPLKYNTICIGKLVYTHHNDIGDCYWETLRPE